MSTEDWLNLAGGICIALGSLLGLVAAVGLVRLPDSLNRMHAASKPQSLGIVIICIGLGLILREPVAWSMLTLVAVLQLLTTPTASQMISRSAYRTGQYRRDLQFTDDSDEDASRSEHRGL